MRENLKWLINLSENEEKKENEEGKEVEEKKEEEKAPPKKDAVSNIEIFIF